MMHGGAQGDHRMHLRVPTLYYSATYYSATRKGRIAMWITGAQSCHKQAGAQPDSRLQGRVWTCPSH
jgi:hypothetical protein